MTLAHWIPALTTSTFLVLIGAALAPFFKAAVEKAVQHGFDRQLEELKGQLRRDEERFRAELRARDDQIAALRSGPLAAMAQRQASLDSRRTLAAERIWTAVVDLAALKGLANMTGPIKLDALIDRASKRGSDATKIREFADTLLKTAGVTEVKFDNSPDKERPFLDPVTWAMFSAYRQLLSYPAMRLLLAKGGLERDMMSNTDVLLQPIKAALPEYADYIDKFGLDGLHGLIQPLEDKLLSSLVAGLSGQMADQASVKQATSILKAVEDAAATLNAKAPPET